MNTPLKALLWKEWQEQKWKLAALTGVLLAFLFLAIESGRSKLERAEIHIDVTQAHLDQYFIAEVFRFSNLVLIGYGILASMLLAMSVAGKENGRRTMRFLKSLPVPMWQAATVKLLMGFVVMAIPAISYLAGVWVVVNLVENPEVLESATQQFFRQTGRTGGFESWFIERLVSVILGAASLLLWVTAGGTNRSDEVSSLAVGFLAVAVTWMAFGWLVYLGERHEIKGLLFAATSIFAALPGALAFVPGAGGSNHPAFDNHGSAWPFVVIVSGIVGHSAVLLWYLRRYGRAVPHFPQLSISEWSLVPWRRFSTGPCRTQFGAIAWKQFRETGPLALSSVLIIICSVQFIYWFRSELWQFRDIAAFLGLLALIVGYLVTVVSGLGVLLEDHKPKVNAFWRSRPVNVNIWFSVQYLTGLLVIAMTFGPVLFFAYRWQDWHVSHEVVRAHVLALILLYSLSLASCAYIRQPILAILLSFAVLLAGWFGYALLAQKLDGLRNEESLVATVLGALALTVTLAYLAVKHDWGWKR